MPLTLPKHYHAFAFKRDTHKGTSETAPVRSLQPATSLSKTFAEPYFLAHRALRGIFNLKHIIAQIFEGVKEEYKLDLIMFWRFEKCIAVYAPLMGGRRKTGKGNKSTG